MASSYIGFSVSLENLQQDVPGGLSLQNYMSQRNSHGKRINFQPGGSRSMFRNFWVEKERTKTNIKASDHQPWWRLTSCQFFFSHYKRNNILNVENLKTAKKKKHEKVEKSLVNPIQRNNHSQNIFCTSFTHFVIILFNILVLYKFQSIWSFKYFFSSFPNIILLTFSYVILYTLKSKFSIAKLLSPNSYTKFN